MARMIRGNPIIMSVKRITTSSRTPAVARDGTETDPDNESDRHDDDRGREQLASAVENAAEQIATQLIRAEQMGGRGRPQPRRNMLLNRIEPTIRGAAAISTVQKMTIATPTVNSTLDSHFAAMERGPSLWSPAKAEKAVDGASLMRAPR